MILGECLQRRLQGYMVLGGVGGSATDEGPLSVAEPANRDRNGRLSFPWERKRSSAALLLRGIELGKQ